MSNQESLVTKGSSSTVRIGSFTVGVGQPALVIAEIGINHNGDISIAKRLIEEAVRAGCSAVKFQKRTVSVVYAEVELAKQRQVPPHTGIMENAVRRGILTPEAVTRLEGSNFENNTNGDLKYALEFTEEEYAEIDRFCKELGIMWFASPWDEGSVDFLEKFNPPCHKVASASITDQGLLERLRDTGRPIILSTGMSTHSEVARAVEIVGQGNLVLLHTVSTYPTKNEGELNIRMIETLRGWFPDVLVGYSGHEMDLLPSFVAVSLGAVMIERHFTLDRSMWGSDQQASISFSEMRELVEGVSRITAILGDGKKSVTPGEIEVQRKLRRKSYY